MTPPLPIVVTHRASAQIEAADVWWAENRPAAPGAIREELACAFELLARHPEIGAAARNVRLKGVRRIHLSRVRYHVYYGTTAVAVEVLAFWHSSRGSAPNV